MTPPTTPEAAAPARGLFVDDSRSLLARRVADIGVVVRQCAYVAAALSNLLSPDVDALWPLLLALGLAVWGILRLITRSTSSIATAVDVGWTLAMAATIPWFTTTTELRSASSISLAVVGATIATLAVQLPLRWSLPTAVLCASAYCWGAAAQIGWGQLLRLDHLYLLAAVWSAAVVLRVTMRALTVRSAEAYEELNEKEIAHHVANARRDFDREQLALLHDTAAATLLLVSQTSAIPPERLAAQARHDLAALAHTTQPRKDELVDVVPLLREVSAHVGIATTYSGMRSLRLDGDLGAAVVAATREALNNVDRHSGANSVAVAVSPDHIAIIDDGRGFNTESTRVRGIGESVVGRMQRCGGTARIRSTPGSGTTVYLSWRARGDVKAQARTLAPNSPVTPRGPLVAAAVAVVILAVGLWQAGWPLVSQPLQLCLGLVAAVCIGSSLFLNSLRHERSAYCAIALLLTVALLQQSNLDPAQLQSRAAWSQLVIGFAVLPFLLGWSAIRGAVLLVALWIIPGGVALVREPSMEMLSCLVLGAATFLIPQIAAHVFSASARFVLTEQRRMMAARRQLDEREAIAKALQGQYLDRYSSIVNRLIPLLTTLARGDSVTDAVRHRAHVESRRLRTLFDEASPNTPLLSRRIHSLITDVEERGIKVSAHIDGELPPLPAHVAEPILRQVDAALDSANTWARIVVTAAQEAELEVSLTCDLSDQADAVKTVETLAGEGEVVVTDDTLWLTVRAS